MYMNIKFIFNKSYPQFEVFEGNKMIAHIKIDEETRGFRIRYNDSRRVFFISDNQNKKNSVFNLINEYSQILGSLSKNKTETKSGEIYIEGVEYKYKIYDDFLKEINLFTSTNEAVLSCKMDIENFALFNKNYMDYALLTLTWLAFLNKEQLSFSQREKVYN